MFRDRIEAGHLLAQRLSKYRDLQALVLAVPKGGVPVAYVIAKELELPLEIVLSKKIGHPMNKEYAIGSVSLYDDLTFAHPGVSQEYVDDEIERVRKRLSEMHSRYMGDQPPQAIEGKVIILVDDGIATGSTLLSAIELLRKSRPKKIVIAVPVASSRTVRRFKEEVDEVVSLLSPDTFYGVGAFYEDFKQVTDVEVIHYLRELRNLNKSKQKSQ